LAARGHNQHGHFFRPRSSAGRQCRN
jgi:hypothetical protein